MSKQLTALAMALCLAASGVLGFDVAAQGAPCLGCKGSADLSGGDVAPPPCVGSEGVPADWEIAVSIEMGSGACSYVPGVDGAPGHCEEKPCSTAVTYAWGMLAAGGIKSIGYQRVDGAARPHTELTFPDGKPWTPGEFGTVSFDSGNSPQLPCGASLSFYISGNMCGPMMASVEGGCSNCWNLSGGE
jgi:hypothetical protein